MKITLYDNIHPTAGAWGKGPRPSIGDAVRAPWVKAMHGRLCETPADGGRFAADLDVDVGLLRVRVVRHGTALSAVWSVGAEERPVAASVLLAGAAASDDESAVRALRGRTPRLPFGEADYAAVLAQRRPCLATLYLDGRWYDNARVELPATALALAALQGAEGRLTVRGGEQTAAPAAHGVSSPFSTVRPDGLKFNFTRARLEHVMGMVTRKGNAAMRGLPGVHFRVYPPREFLDRPGALKGRGLYDRLKGTAWWVKWYDGRCDQLEFGELLGFVDQLIEVERAFREARGGEAPAEATPQNISVWGRDGARPGDGSTPVRVGRTLDTRKIVEDEYVRRAFSAIMLEPAPIPETVGALASHGVSTG